MKVNERSWQAAGTAGYKTSTGTQDAKKSTDKNINSASNPESTLAQKASEKASGNSGSNFKMKSSAPDDSVGQLASELARAETRLDVQQVYSKAMRALANLKMSALSSEGKEAKKIDQMVRRMEKLIKRIQKKLKHLNKEEQLENRRKQAEKQQKLEKEQELREEIKARKNKRRRDERNYANKEMAEDIKESNQELMASLSGAGAFTSSSLTPSGVAGQIMAGGDLAGGLAAAEGTSVDILV